MSVLSSAASLCTAIISERPSVRKQAANKLGLLLKDPKFGFELNKASRENSSVVTWDVIIQNIGKLVFYEIETKKDDVSPTSYNRKHKEAGSLYQNAVQTADKFAGLKRVSSVFGHILTVLSSVPDGSILLDIYSQLLCNCLLLKKSYYQDISVKKWHDFLEFYFVSLTKSLANVSRRVLWAQVIRQLLSFANKMAYIYSTPIAKYFADLFPPVKRLKDITLVEHLLCALNTFSSSCFTDAQITVLNLADDLFQIMLHLWNYEHVLIKVELVKFFKTQVLILSAIERQCKLSGYCHIDEDNWKSHYEDLFEICYEALSPNAKRSRQRKIDWSGRTEMITLAVHTMKKMLLSLPSSRISSSSAKDLNGNPFRKKGKQHIGNPWDFLLEGINHLHQVETCTAWLLVVKGLLSEFDDDIFTEDQYMALLKSLRSLLDRHSGQPIVIEILKTLSKLIETYMKTRGLHGDINNLVVESWKYISKMEDSCFNEEWLHYIYILWKNGAIHPDVEIFLLLINKTKCQPNRQSLQLLQFVMKSGFIFDKPPIVDQKKWQHNEKSIRQRLLSWLLPTDEHCIQILFRDIHRDSILILCKLTVVLASSECVKDLINASIRQFHYNDVFDMETKQVHSYTHFKRLTNLVFKTFDNHIKPTRLSTPVESRMDNTSPWNPSLLDVIVKVLQNRIEAFHKVILLQMQDGLDTPCWQNYFIFLLSFFGYVHTFNGCEPLRKSLICKISEVVMKICNMLKSHLSSLTDKKLNLDPVNLCLESICYAIECASSAKKLCKIKEFSMLTGVLFQLLNKDTFPEITSSSQEPSGRSSFSLDMMDFEDCEEDTKVKDDEKHLTYDETFVQSIKKCRVLSCAVLVHLLVGRANKEFVEKRRKLLQEEWESPHNIYVYFSFMKTIEKSCYKLSFEETAVLVSAARQQLSHFKSDQDICYELLCCITHLVKLLVQIDSSDVKHQKLVVVKIVEVFWCIMNEKYSPHVRIKMSKLLQAITQVDQTDEIWKFNIKQDIYTAFDLLCEMLRDGSLLVQVHICEILAQMLQEQQIAAKEKPFCKFIKNLHDYENGNVTSKDSEFNKTLTVIVAMKEIMIKNNHLEEHGIWMLLNNTIQNTIKSSDVFTILKSLSKSFGYEDFDTYLQSRIGFLVGRYLTSGYPIQQFPTLCFGMQPVEFFKRYCSFVLPFMVMDDNFQVIEEIHNEFSIVNGSWKQLLTECFPTVIAFTLLEHFEDGNVVPSVEKSRDTCFLKLRECLGIEVFVKELKQNIEEVIYQLLLHLPECNKITPDLILPALILHLGKYFSDIKASIDIFALHPILVPNILTMLAKRITEARRCHEYLTLFQSYKCFIDFLLRNIGDLHQSCGHYLVKDLIYRSFYFLDEKFDVGIHKDVIELCFAFLKTLIDAGHEHPYVMEEIRYHHTFIVHRIQYIIENCLCEANGEVSISNWLLVNKSLEILQLILMECDLKIKYLLDTATLVKLTSNNESLADLFNVLSSSTGDSKEEQCFPFLRKEVGGKPMTILKNIKRNMTCQSFGPTAPHTDLMELLSSTVNEDTCYKIFVVECIGVLINSHANMLQGGNLRADEKLPEMQLIFEAVLSSCTSQDVHISQIAINCLQQTFATRLWVDVLPFVNSSYASMKYLLAFQTKFKSLKKRINRCVKKSLNAQSLSVCGKLFTEEWLQELVSTLLSFPAANVLLSLLQPLCKTDYGLAMLSLPYILQSVLQVEENRQSINSFFNTSVKEFLRSSMLQGCIEKMSLLIRAVAELRRFDVPSEYAQTNTAWDKNFWLNINHYEFAKACIHCKQYETGAMFCEIWTDELRTQQLMRNNQCLLSGDEERRENPLQILNTIYTNLCDLDLIHGVGVVSKTVISTRHKCYELEKQFHMALLTADIQCSTQDAVFDIPKGLMSAGLYHTTLLYLNGINQEERGKYAEIQYEAAWRNSQWDDAELRSVFDFSNGFHENIYRAIASLSCYDEDLFYSHVKNAKLCISEHFSSSQNIFTNVTDICAKSFTVHQLDYVGNLFLRGGLKSVDFPTIAANDFDFVEPSLSIFVEVLKIACNCVKTGCKEELIKSTVEYITKSSKAAREAKRFEIAEKFLAQIPKINVDHSVALDWKLEEAKLFWARDETTSAICLLDSLRDHLGEANNDSPATIYPVVLSLYGHWCGETQSKNPAHIIEEYLQPAIVVMEKATYSGTYTPIDAYHSLAKYADSHHESLVEYLNSEIIQRKKQVIRRSEEDLKNSQTFTAKNKDVALKRHYSNLKKQCLEDQKEVEQISIDLKQFLEKSVLNYAKCLQHGDKYDLKILRLCSLWFKHYSEGSIATILQSEFAKMQSRKFLPVMHQLAARLGSDAATNSAEFNHTLEQIIERCICDHAPHSLFILLALCNADVDEKFTGRREASKQNFNNRIHAANKVLEPFRNINPKYLENAERLAKAYIELAYWDISHLKCEKGPFRIPDSKMLLKIQHLSNVAIPTCEVEVDPLCEYKNVPYILQFESTFSHAGGVNLPKILTCHGSDGQHRRQLVKGRDDLRQDAVMQQVFGLVNKLLLKDGETRKRNLKMRTYKVVPLSKKSGLMKWCDGTTPIGNYLIGGRDGSLGAHQRYYPKDWTPKHCRNRLTEANSGKGRHSKHNAYLEIEKHFHPVLRHFFLERFTDPCCWFTKRLGYTRSVAVSSFVGYVVGLGDRHCQNILIDCDTADVIHIDLGVAFEQGKYLPTPETVPFRLTRDIVDGMGSLGVEGVYRRCGEKTMSVLRTSQDSILTVVEVLLHDPLSAWTLSSEKMSRLQNRKTIGSTSNDTRFEMMRSTEADGNGNKMAERVLLRLKQKLCGSEGGTFLGINGQVNYLIQQARNTENLCQLFPGWQPWM